RPAWVLRRGVFRAPGFTRYTRALYRSEAERFAFEDRDDIYGDVSAFESPILFLAGPGPTYAIGGQRVGSDKLDHFLSVGFAYYRHTARGGTEEEAVRSGVRTEYRLWGMFTSRTFSFADLRANHDGYRFYAELLEPGSAFDRDTDGCVERVGAWSWAAWVHAQWDEVLDPSVYAEVVGQRVLDTLAARRAAVCSSRKAWDDGVRAWAEPDAPWLAGPRPVQGDPFQLDALCDPTRRGPLRARPPRRAPPPSGSPSHAPREGSSPPSRG
ncbi:MAG: hypothetical protein KC656_03520, partial [Myxococcales bacterium]|nr:hypothetical protein [Myxococcales bacterium]